MSERMTLKESISRFFCDTAKAEIFFKALYCEGPYDRPPNKEETPESLVGTNIYEMMMVRNYKNANPRSDVNFEDVHHEFVDFIIQTAVLHRALDTPMGIPEGVKRAVQGLNFGETINNVDFNRLIALINGERIMRNDSPLPITLEETINLTIDALLRNYNVDEVVKNNVRNEFKKIFTSFVAEVSRRQINQNSNRNDVNKIRIKLISSLEGVASDVLRSTVSRVTPYSSVSRNPLSVEFCKYILSNWGNLNVQAKEFYRHHLSIFEKNADGSWNSDDKLRDDRYMAKCITACQNGACDSDNLRINLKKAERGGEMTMFAHTLPYVPLGRKVWFTNDRGDIVSIDNYNSDVLKQLYMAVLKDTPNVTIGNTPYRLPTEANCHQNSEWNLNLPNIVRNIVNLHVRKGGKGPVTKITELVDLQTNTTVYNDFEEGMYKLVNGKKVFYSDKEFNCDNTLALNKKYISEADCESLASCILHAPEKLQECLSKLQNHDMFDVGQEELRKLHPLLARKLLEVFHVKMVPQGMIDRNGNSYKQNVPMSFAKWQSEVLNGPNHTGKGWNPDFKRIIQKSEKLQKYISGVIEFVRSNPAILNPNHAHPADIQDDDEQLRILNNTQNKLPYAIGNYQWPYEVNGSGYSGPTFATVGMLANTLNSSVFSVNPSVLAQPYSNALTGNGVMGMGVGLLNTMGGGAITATELLSEAPLRDKKNYLKELLVDLKKEGLMFSPEQEQEISKFCNELEENEKKLMKLVETVELLRNLQKFVRCAERGKYAEKVTGKVLLLDEINNNRDLMAWLNQNIGDYENCIYKGIEVMNDGSAQVVNAYVDLIKNSSK